MSRMHRNPGLSVSRTDVHGIERPLVDQPPTGRRRARKCPGKVQTPVRTGCASTGTGPAERRRRNRSGRRGQGMGPPGGRCTRINSAAAHRRTGPAGRAARREPTRRATPRPAKTETSCLTRRRIPHGKVQVGPFADRDFAHTVKLTPVKSGRRPYECTRPTPDQRSRRAGLGG